VSDAFQEVEQSLREESLARWWKRLMPFVIGAVVLIVGAVGVYEFMRWQRAEAVSAAGRTFDAGFVALEAGDLATARARFAELANNDTGFAVLAGHMLAGVERDLTNDTAAIEGHLKTAAAADEGVMGDLAMLKLGYLSADTATRAELEASLKPLLDKQSQASLLARELVAAKALAEGDVDYARDTFEVLNVDLNAPLAMRQRVAQALATLPAREVNLDAPTPPAAPATAPAATDAAPAATPPAQDTAPEAPTGQPQQ
jgi:hypothetical protein